MTKKVFEVTFADIPVRYSFRSNSTARYFGRHIHLSKSDHFDIRMNDEEFKLFRQTHSSDIPDDYVEYKGLIYLTAGRLLKDHCCIMHAVSFLWKGKAWLLTAESGTGKTTQYMNWSRLFPEEITMISGDMPVMDFRDDIITVWPSPWNGKESIGNPISGELGGIIILKQDLENKIEHTEPAEGIITLFRQFTAAPETAEEITIIADMVQQIMEKVPVWIFSNNGTDESTSMLRNTLLAYLAEEE